MEGNDELYREIILDNYRNPKNRGRIERPDGAAFDSNPLCGDEVRIEVLVRRGVVNKIRFEGSGCAISIACASMLASRLEGKKLSQVQGADKKLVLGLLGGIDPGPSRIKCAMLPLKVLKLALLSAKSKKLNK
ncbi:iron-sulfur cluster assembly scaffold protein [Candidatus Parvarchaeota archaeon]|nr:iron-sulfur cluster assembly scaffold protein [Candidatus Parvarchaeota archaeon]